MRPAQSKLIALICITCGLLALFLGRLVFAPNVLYSGDTARGYLPQRTALAEALRAGELPWWESRLGAGYPLLAEGETGAWYPLNWLLLLIFPSDLSLNASLVLHLVLSMAGTWLWLRRHQLHVVPAYMGAFVFTFGGFMSAHNSHLSILTVAAWLPWLLVTTNGLLWAKPKHTAGWAAAFTLVVALQFLAGHAQISLLILGVVALYAIYLLVNPRSGSDAAGRQAVHWQRLALWLAALIAGAILAGPQLAASWQLSQLSTRAGGLDPQLFTSFSFHPFLAATFIAPFLLGNPYPNGSVELMGYLGLLPLVLALYGLLHSKHSIRWFLLALVIGGLLLAFGRYNPVYPYLLHIPVFNLFRVPARFLLWVDLGLSGLFALGLESVLAAGRSSAPAAQRRALTAAISALLGTIAILVVARATTDELVALWRWLPVLLAGGITLLALALPRTPRERWLALAGCLVVLDLYGYNRLLNLTFNQVAPLATVRTAPQVVSWLAQDKELFRVYTKEEILPIEFVQKESLYPNYALTYGQASANLYAPLLPTTYQDYMEGLDARRLDTLNVRYYIIPQLLPVDEASELYDVQNPFADLLYSQWMNIEPTDVITLEVQSYLSHAAELPCGTLAANILLQTTAGDTITLPIRAGIESAEWAYERPDVRAVITYPMPPTATTYPARSGYPAVNHLGHTYLARWPLSPSTKIQAVYIQPVIPEAYVRIEQVRLYAPDGEMTLLNHLIGRGDYQMVFRSEDVLAYRNNDARPRAFIISSQDARPGEDGICLEDNLPSMHKAEILVYQQQYAEVRANLAEAGYLILADMAYPGWSVQVDGRPAKLLTADGLFRAVALEPGEHLVTFRYRFSLLPASRRE